MQWWHVTKALSAWQSDAHKGSKNMMSHPITPPLDVTVPGASACLPVPPALDRA
jgi:hypothetical protein